MQTCLQCGMIFDSKVSGRRKFCGAGCMTKWHSAHTAQVRQESRNLRGTCPVCGLVFVKSRESQRYCSNKCRNDRWNGIKNPKVIYDRVCKLCGQSFQTAYKRQCLCQHCSRDTRKGASRVEPRVRLSILERQNGKCYLCGGELDSALAVVHHLDASGHRAKPNNALDNLVAVHDRCHSMFHRVHLVYRDGVWGVDGRIFDYVKPESLVVMKTDRDQGS